MAWIEWTISGLQGWHRGSKAKQAMGTPRYSCVCNGFPFVCSGYPGLGVRGPARGTQGVRADGGSTQLEGVVARVCSRPYPKPE